jgi:uncharacterized lipoprotein YmbA
MMTAPRLPLFLMLAGLLGLAGCSTHQPVSLYQLDSGSPAQPAQTAGMAVLLGPVIVADYLQRETLLQRTTEACKVPWMVVGRVAFLPISIN